MMNTATFGKTQYHLKTEMQAWCLDNIGPGSWTDCDVKDWPDTDATLWFISSWFGNTTFYFKHERHCTWFKLRWK